MRVCILVLVLLITILFINNICPNDNFNATLNTQMCRHVKPKIVESNIFNKEAYIDNNWHLRFPALVKSRYSFDETDANISVIPNGFAGYAPLNELAINIKKEL